MDALEAMAAPRAGEFLFGDTLTLADVCLVPQLYNARRFNVPIEGYPTLLRADENAASELAAFAAAHPDRSPGGNREMNRVDAINRGMAETKPLESVEIPSLQGQGQRRGMGDPRRSRRRLSDDRSLRLGRPHLHPFVGAHPGARASFPAQPVQSDVRGGDGVVAGEGRQDGNPVEPTPFITNPAGFTIHSAIHMAREDAHAVMHLHTPAGQAVSAHSEGLLPLTQTAMLIRGEVAFHDYEGVAVDLDERERLVADSARRMR